MDKAEKLLETNWETINLVIGALMVIFFAYMIISSIQLFVARVKVTKNPTEKNAYILYKRLCRIGVTIQNHPKVWGQFRDMFYRVNNSADIPPELKENIKARLVKKGLYINNVRIINNYKNEE